jgi:hypothetical protein
MRINFLGQEENPELLLPSASDRVWVGAIAEDRRPRLDDERLAGFNQSADLSTYPRKISVRASRATANCCVRGVSKLHNRSEVIVNDREYWVDLEDGDRDGPGYPLHGNH